MLTLVGDSSSVRCVDIRNGVVYNQREEHESSINEAKGKGT